MADAVATYGTAFTDGSAILMARVVDADAGNIAQADISTITYSVYLLDDSDPTSRTVQTGHDAAELVVADTIYDALQTDSTWTADSTGYNFRHVVDRSIKEAFGTAGRNYLVEHTLTPTSGQIILLQFRINVL